MDSHDALVAAREATQELNFYAATPDHPRFVAAAKRLAEAFAKLDYTMTHDAWHQVPLDWMR